MILLDGHSLKQARKIPLHQMSLSLKERDSTATIVPADMTGIGINSWMKDDTEPGKGIVWRVRSIGETYTSDSATVQLEHAIMTLRDLLLFGEVTPAKITGKKADKECTAKQAVEYILKQSPDWTLGSFSYGSVTNPYKFDGDTLLDALETVTNSLAGAVWSYDFSVYPFKLSITKESEEIGSVMRANRNIRTITRTVEKGGMYTRFYPIGKNDLHVNSKGYIERNTKAYGVISKVETDQTIETVAELERWANERLAVHAEPAVTIVVEGYEIAEATGQSLDSFAINRMCRIPLSEWGTTITARITALDYADKVNQPEIVRVTMGNRQQDITKIIADALKSGGGGGRAAAKKDKEDMAWFEDTEEHVAMCAKGIIGTDAKGNPNWTRLSEIVVDGEGIHQSVTGLWKDMETATTKIEQNENAISLEAKRAIGEEKNISGQIKLEHDRISLVVTEKNGKDVIDTASIVTGINNQTGSYVKIKAKTIELSGYVTMEKFNSIDGRVTNLMTGNTVATKINAVTLQASQFKFQNSTVSWRLVNIPGYGYLNYLGA